MRSQAIISLAILELETICMLDKNQRSTGLIIMIALLVIGRKV